jgi:hypothetical protein
MVTLFCSLDLDPVRLQAAMALYKGNSRGTTNTQLSVGLT